MTGTGPDEMGFASKAAMWVGVSFFYATMFIPLLSRFSAEARGLSDPVPALGIAGAAITAIGAGMLNTWLQWTLALVGYLSIAFIMVGAARRLEGTQGSRYGQDAEFRAYAAKTPILVPFVPPIQP